MTPSYDLHLSAEQISRATISELEALGFRRDEFANNTRCYASAYHATYRGAVKLPDDRLWNLVCERLQADPEFSGTLEEEATEPRHRADFHGAGKRLPTSPGGIGLVADIPPGKHKACDLHISVSLNQSTSEALDFMESMKLISFDKPTAEGVRRVYSVTCETFEEGEQLFKTMSRLLGKVHGLAGKLKLERTTRYLRKPDDAAMLPLTIAADLNKWLTAIE